MKLKNLFNIFLVLVLVAGGVYFVTGLSYWGTPATNTTYVRANYTITVYTDEIVHVDNVMFYNMSNNETGSNNHPILNGPSMGNVTNTSVGTLALGSFTLNDTNIPADGNYTFTAIFLNESRTGNVTVNTTLLIDSTPPEAVILSSPEPNKTFAESNSSTIQFGFNVTDAMSGNSSYGELLNCSLIIDGVSINDTIKAPNATDVHNSTGTLQFNVSATSFAATSDGFHTWNVTCWDKAGNFNGSATQLSYGDEDYNMRGGNFTLTDTTGPTTGAPSFSAASVAKDANVVITCTGTDAISSDPVEEVSVRAPGGQWQDGIGSSPYTFQGTGTAGTYTARCRSSDVAGNNGDWGTTATFTVSQSSSSSQQVSTPSSGGPSTPTVTAYTGQTRDLGSIVGTNGIIKAYRAATVNFDVTTSSEATSSSHSMVFDDVNYIDGQITITISSDPVTLTMNVDDVTNVDLDGDGVDDVEVTLNGIDQNGQVDMNIKDLITETPPSGGEEGAAAGGDAEGVTEGRGMSWIWWVVIIIVIIVILALVLPKKKR
tara:strand:- start:233 stop:1861 length:1629 start_codon:yes stop_codon:yes gene_type:complete